MMPCFSMEPLKESDNMTIRLYNNQQTYTLHQPQYQSSPGIHSISASTEKALTSKPEAASTSTASAIDPKFSKAMSKHWLVMTDGRTSLNG